METLADLIRVLPVKVLLILLTHAQSQTPQSPLPIAAAINFAYPITRIPNFPITTMDHRTRRAKLHSAGNTTSRVSAAKSSDTVSPSLLSDSGTDLAKFAASPSWAFRPTLGGVDLITNQTETDRPPKDLLENIRIADRAYTRVVETLVEFDEHLRLEIISEAVQLSLLDRFTEQNAANQVKSTLLRSYVVTDVGVWRDLINVGACPIRAGSAWTRWGFGIEAQLAAEEVPETTIGSGVGEGESNAQPDPAASEP